MYKHLFGPVPSRRLGMSLGVDLIPHKICSLNCVYCECGSTTRLTREREAYVPVEDIYRELVDFFENNPDPEFITFSGAGEPTLHCDMGEVLGFIKELRPNIPVALISNGTLFSDPVVRKDLMRADIVLPSLDAAIEKAFHATNRPLKNFSIDQYIQGLVSFRKEFKGEIWLEVFILPGYNDCIENIDSLKEAIIRIEPDRIQLNTLDRPGTQAGLIPAGRAELERIADRWDFENLEIILPANERKHVKSYRADVESAILETITRRPCTLEDLEKILGIHIHEINKYLGAMEESGIIETTEQERGVFYQLK